MIPSIRSGLVLGATLLAACSSQPVQHYSLLSVTGSDNDVASSRSAVAAVPLLLDVLPVGLPAVSDRQELVVRQGDRFIILENARWAAALSDEMRDALGVLMQRRLGGRNVIGLVPPAGAPVLRVKVMVRQFEVVPGQSVLIDADWSLTRNDRPEVARLLCHTRKSIAAPAANNTTALVRAYQMALEALAGQIADAAGAWAANGNESCPPPAA